MSETDENAPVQQAADAIVAYESGLQRYIQDRPLTAVAVAVVVGAMLARFLF